MAMTFAEFQATQKKVPARTFADAVGLDVEQLGSDPVLAYGTDHSLWIGDRDSDGNYYLMIGRSEWLQPVLEELERELYQFAIDEEIV
jgi:hypothetical protein